MKFATNGRNSESAGVRCRRTVVHIKKKVINEIGCAEERHDQNSSGLGGACR